MAGTMGGGRGGTTDGGRTRPKNLEKKTLPFTVIIYKLYGRFSVTCTICLGRKVNTTLPSTDESHSDPVSSTPESGTKGPEETTQVGCTPGSVLPKMGSTPVQGGVW